MLFVVFFIVLMCLILFGLKYSSKKSLPSTKHAILITGCDSGIGYSIAKHCHKLGFTVFAGCLNTQSDGFQLLKELQNVYPFQLDVTDKQSIQNAFITVNNTLKNRSEIALKTVINNAGIMVFGEFAWQTEDQIHNQIMVNLIGAMNVTRTFLPFIRRNKGRLINICSHCSLEALPGLSVYAASKAGLLAWTIALRVELRKFDINVISLIPGSFPQDTRIFSQHEHHVEDMKANMSPEEWQLYKNYFEEYNYYLSFIRSPTTCHQIVDDCFYKMLDKALMSIHPRAHYCYSPRRYFIYHSLFKITPVFIRDWLVLKFVNMPQWKTK